jgi:hypothetical protein
MYCLLFPLVLTFGQPITMNPFSLVFVFLFLATDLGASEGPPSWTSWRADCQLCQLQIGIGEGIFCANISAKRDPWTPFLRAWHGRCYIANDNGEFPIVKPQDEMGEFIIASPEDDQQFLVARDGDNLVTPFQCDHCHFINVMGREPVDGLASDV